ncbi:hypothetical protein ACWF2L_21595 [Streptomyces anulatus]
MPELHHDAEPDGGSFGTLAQTLTLTAHLAEQVQQHPDGVASFRLHEAVGLTTNHVARRIAGPRPASSAAAAASRGCTEAPDAPREKGRARQGHGGPPDLRSPLLPLASRT